MSVYAIGDVQGCFAELESLLDKISFDRASDRLWFVGDLVNRGPQSLEVLRFVKNLGASAISVLGNHDIHLLAVAEGGTRAKAKDTFDDVLAAPDRDELLDWLRQRPLMHVDNDDVLVHAGLLPGWTVAYAQALASEVEETLRVDSYREFLRILYGDAPEQWSEELSGYDRLRVIINALTRLRICTKQGAMDFSHKAGLEKIPPDYFPWFDAPNRASVNARVICGHWSALGLLLRPNLLALDSGCVWGRALSAVRLRDLALFQVECSKRSWR
ncbi:MAG: symmetrical bis(5'-nucleosyl)-tetraphosphatase [Burkholderiales bacterium]